MSAEQAPTPVTDFVVGRMYRSSGLPGLDPVLAVCFKRCKSELKGRVVGDLSDSSKPRTLELVEVPSKDWIMVAMNHIMNSVRSSANPFYEIPDSEQDPDAASKFMAAFEKKNKTAYLKEQLENMIKSHQEAIDTLAMVQKVVNEGLHQIKEMDQKIDEIKDQIKELEETEAAN